jgi:hypothetical protein
LRDYDPVAILVDVIETSPEVLSGHVVLKIVGGAWLALSAFFVVCGWLCSRPSNASPSGGQNETVVKVKQRLRSRPMVPIGNPASSLHADERFKIITEKKLVFSYNLFFLLSEIFTALWLWQLIGHFRPSTTPGFHGSLGAEMHAPAVVHGFYWLVVAAELVGALMSLITNFNMVKPVRRETRLFKDCAPDLDPEEYPLVDVLICHYEEDTDDTIATLEKAMKLDWPTSRLHIYVIDDGYFNTTSKDKRTEVFQAWWKQKEVHTFPAPVVVHKDHERWLDKLFSKEIAGALRVLAGCLPIPEPSGSDATPATKTAKLNADLVMKMVCTRRAQRVACVW